MNTLPDTLRALLEQPTAPFYEEAVAAEIERQLTGCPHVTLTRDSFGNLIAQYRRGNAETQWAFAAHMDHPGWVRAEGEWEFLGGVPKEYFTGDPPRRVHSEFAQFAMWDLPAFELRGDRLHSRACDDLVGCAVIVEMLRELERTGAECTCLGLFTRAEEVGFVGAMELAKSGVIPKTVTILSLETSAERPPAVMGEGVIVRVGDKTSIFDPAVTAALSAVATEAKIRFQRCLMPGGTCEATAYALYGYRCGALCVALGNYHNCGPQQRIAPEFVALPDVRDLTALCLALANRRGSAPDAAAALKTRLEQNLASHERFFRPL